MSNIYYNNNSNKPQHRRLLSEESTSDVVVVSKAKGLAMRDVGGTISGINGMGRLISIGSNGSNIHDKKDLQKINQN